MLLQIETVHPTRRFWPYNRVYLLENRPTRAQTAHTVFVTRAGVCAPFSLWIATVDPTRHYKHIVPPAIANRPIRTHTIQTVVRAGNAYGVRMHPVVMVRGSS